MQYVWFYFLMINVISILLVVLDKSAARNGGDRIRERTLLIFAAIGGAIGMYAAMRIIHHKTRKNKFMVGIPAIILGEIGIFLMIYFNFFK